MIRTKHIFQISIVAIVASLAIPFGGAIYGQNGDADEQRSTAIESAAARPNIVLILTDDQGWSQLSALMDPDLPTSKSDYLETPNLARLMADGLRFTSGYSPAPLCTPTRRSILCGTSAARSGTEFASKWVPADHLTIPMALKQADSNYRCAHFGKWGSKMISTPEECGYDVSDGMTTNGTGGMPKTLGVESGDHNEGPPHFIDNHDPKRTRSITDRTIEFMRENAQHGNPFYVQASYFATHLSVVCSDAALAKFKNKGTPDRVYTEAWAAMLLELDQGVGRVLGAIEKLQLADKTYLFFTADNGGRGSIPGGSISRVAANFPLTGAKHSLFEGGTRVPFIVRGPGVRPGSVCRVPVVGYDFLPTFYQLAGGSIDLGKEIDGVSLKPLLHEPEQGSLQRPSGALYFHRPGRRESTIRKGDFKLRLIWDDRGSVVGRELYQVDANPTEEGFDIARKEPARADALQKQLLDYLVSVDAEKVKAAKKRKKRSR
jgi:arylsulfatase A-like enzyme